MKKRLLQVVVAVSGIFFVTQAYACIGSDCKPCPDGFFPMAKCCAGPDSDDCVFLNDDIEDCGAGRWKEYPRSIPVDSRECCTDATENDCLTLPVRGRCGTGVFKGRSYTPLKKCCRDDASNDCVIIRAKKRCGKYQLEKYPSRRGDCCAPDLTKCTERVTDCPKCI